MSGLQTSTQSVYGATIEWTQIPGLFMDNGLAKALAYKAELEKQVEIARARIERLDQYIELHASIFGTDEEQKIPEKGTHSQLDESESLGVKRTRGLPAAVAAAAERLIRGAGTPLSRGELLKRMLSEGMQFDSPDAPRYVGTVLWRHSHRFENIEGRGYWLKGEPVPPSVFD